MRSNSQSCFRCHNDLDPRSIVNGDTLCHECHINSSTASFPLSSFRSENTSHDSSAPHSSRSEVLHDKCQLHLPKYQPKKFKKVCLTCEERICTNCAIHGDHRSEAHVIEDITYLNEAIAHKIKSLENYLFKMDKFAETSEKMYEEQKKIHMNAIESGFTAIESFVKTKKLELKQTVNSLHNQDLEKCRSGIGPNSQARLIITQKISEYQQITRNPKPFELIKENLPDIIEKIEDTVQQETMDQNEVMLQGILLKISSTIKKCLSILESMEVMPKDFACRWKDFDSKINEELPLKQEIVQKEELRESNFNYVKVKRNEVFIVYPFKGDVRKRLGSREDLKHISFLWFWVSKRVKDLTREDIETLRYVRNKFTNVRDIQILIGNYKISDNALRDIYSCLFSKTDALDTIYLYQYMKGSFEKSLLFLSENVLPSTKNLSEFILISPYTLESQKAWTSLINSIYRFAANLTKLHFLLPYKHFQPILIRRLVANLPNLQSFGYWLYSSEFNDQDLVQFALMVLPFLTRLKEFAFNLFGSKVTDSGLKIFFRAFPEEWYSSLKSLGLNFTRSNMTKLRVKELVGNVLFKMKALKLKSSFTGKSLKQAICQIKKKKVSKKQRLSGRVIH